MPLLKSESHQQVDHRGAAGGHDIFFTGTTDQEHRKVKAAYYAMIEQVDTEVGRLLQALDDTEQAENTIVIYMSDHGRCWAIAESFSKGRIFTREQFACP